MQVSGNNSRKDMTSKPKLISYEQEKDGAEARRNSIIIFLPIKEERNAEYTPRDDKTQQPKNGNT